MSRQLQVGDPVIFTATKRGTHPGPRAKEIYPEPHGDAYIYAIDKYWTVRETNGEQVVLVTRRGKIHHVDANDPHLHRASWWQRLIYRKRFPKLEGIGADGDTVA
jgi:hypothetical protein